MQCQNRTDRRGIFEGYEHICIRQKEATKPLEAGRNPKCPGRNHDARENNEIIHELGFFVRS